jgi:septal ring factor EnvC (AmiA/AmiB activator)
MKKEYNKVKHDLYNYADNIEESIRIGFNNQKKENMKIKEQLLNIKNGHYELSKLIRDVKESIEKIKNKIGEV